MRTGAEADPDTHGMRDAGDVNCSWIMQLELLNTAYYQVLVCMEDAFDRTMFLIEGRSFHMTGDVEGKGHTHSSTLSYVSRGAL